MDDEIKKIINRMMNLQKNGTDNAGEQWQNVADDIKSSTDKYEKNLLQILPTGRCSTTAK